MGKYIGPKNKIARRFGVNLGLKSNPVKVARRIKQKPGVHGPNARPSGGSTYAKQLLEKQKAKFMYGIRERQFKRYIGMATKKTGDSSIFLNKILETRFDNVLYRGGFAITRAQGRQMAGHNLFMLNGKKMNIPSHLVKAGDIITVRPAKNNKGIFQGIEERLKSKEMPSWLAVGEDGRSLKVISEPVAEDFEKLFNAKMIIEFYSAR